MSNDMEIAQILNSMHTQPPVQFEKNYNQHVENQNVGNQNVGNQNVENQNVENQTSSPNNPVNPPIENRPPECESVSLDENERQANTEEMTPSTEEEANIENGSANNIKHQENSGSALDLSNNISPEHYGLIDKRFSELLKSLGNDVGKLKKKVAILTEENTRIKQECDRHQNDYSELKTKYEETLQKIEEDKATELNRIKSQKVQDLRELELLSNVMKDLLEGDSMLNSIQVDDMNSVVDRNNNTDTENNTISSTFTTSSQEIRCTLCNTEYANQEGLKRHLKRPLHLKNLRSQKRSKK